ncbi:MAG: holin-associated N-acetylmuramidase [Gemmobacter sp.]
MQTIEDIAREIVAREGGFVNDPDDPGGMTNRGVTLATLRRLGVDIDGDGDADADDLRMLSVDDAAAIFVRHYFHEPRIDRLPPALQASVFDMYVNAGANAVKILQRLLTEMGFPTGDDGKIGPITAANAAAAAAAAPDHIADAYGIARRDYYYAIGDTRKASRKYVRRRNGGKGGWILRAEEFISPRFHLSEAEHSARVSQWA